LKELGGGKISLKELRGKIILLNFFATWWPNCQRESPSFAKLHEEFKNTDLVLLKIETKEKEQDIIKYKNEFKISSPILIDDDGASANAYGIWNRPNTFFINREGKIVGRVVKEMDWGSKNMRKFIQYLVEEKKWINLI
jgi:peroxiredoxin